MGRDALRRPFLGIGWHRSARRRHQVLVVMRVLPLGIDVRQLRREALQGHVSVEQLLNIIEKQQQTIQGLRREQQRLQDRLAQYEPDSRHEASPATSTAPRSARGTDAGQLDRIQNPDRRLARGCCAESRRGWRQHHRLTREFIHTK